MAVNDNKGLNKIQKSMIDPDFVGEVDQLNQQLADTSDKVRKIAIDLLDYGVSEGDNITETLQQVMDDFPGTEIRIPEGV